MSPVHQNTGASTQLETPSGQQDGPRLLPRTLGVSVDRGEGDKQAPTLVKTEELLVERSSESGRALERDVDAKLSREEKLAEPPSRSPDRIGRELGRRRTDISTKQTAETSHHKATLSTSTNALFPPLRTWPEPSTRSSLLYLGYRVSSLILSLAFLAVIVLGALFTSIPAMFARVVNRILQRDVEVKRPFHAEEISRREKRRELEEAWEQRKAQQGISDDQEKFAEDEFTPTEGGLDPIVCDIGYYARRVGLDVEEYDVETEDGFIIALWHVYNPRDVRDSARKDAESTSKDGESQRRIPQPKDRKPKFPVLLIHGLLQSAGAYCVNDDDSLAFYLCKAGYDVWLGNNRCGFAPKHKSLSHTDPRLWCWNIRQMGVMDLHALTTKVLDETGFEKLGLVCHSQGTTQTFVALAKEQRPELGEKITVFCALAPAAYAGQLIGKMYFKFMRIISPAMFRIMFGIHAFIPFMMTMHRIMHPRIYGWLGYKVFSFLFNWTDDRWERDLRDRMFQFAPVYVSAETMSWWLGRNGFAQHKCILSTKDIVRAEEKVDFEMDGFEQGNKEITALRSEPESATLKKAVEACRRKPRGATAWYNDQVPPFALWVAGNDDLVDGKKLLARFERGREPFVRVVHCKVIPEYEHLDVIWAMDAVDQVFSEVKEVLWKTCNVRDKCRVPKGCENIEEWTWSPRSGDEDGSQSSSSSSGHD
ncbi:hypothetical protein jhhlp_006508 [Lomentospora prolificans]|uniref:Partial AB-hydrolase lipase domain-containing protein n=1 Tax=Lomentospora prolificans TaxID=41688 RepID=A0A2N3N631_9PEZI|nr:hypothetical protein jhhlp_006508 [Lomentospora prolificans]